MDPGPRAGRLAVILRVVALAIVAAPLARLAAGAALAPETTDFMCFWTGARFAASGLDPYDAVAWSDAVRGEYADAFGMVRAPPCAVGYAYPFSTAVLMAPLGILPLPIAAAIWQALQLAGLLVGIALLARAAHLDRGAALVFAAAVLGSQPAWLNALTGQMGGLLVLAVALASLESAPSFVVAPLLILKPHVTGVVLLERLSRWPRRAVVGALVAGALCLAVATALRPSWPLEWAREIASHRSAMIGTTPTIWGVASVASGGSVPIALASVLLAAGAFVAALRGQVIRDRLDRVAAATTLGLLITPYLSSADPVVLAVVWAAIAARARGSIAWLLVLVVVADLVPWALYATKDYTVVDVRNGLALLPTAAAFAAGVRLSSAPRDRPPLAHSAATRNG